MGALSVVVLGEFVELVLQFVDRVCWWSRTDPAFQGLVEALDFTLRLWVPGSAVFLLDVVVGQDFFEGVASPFTPG